MDPLRALARRVVPHRVERPAEVDRGWPRRGERLDCGVEVLTLLAASAMPYAAATPMRARRAGEHPDRLGHLHRGKAPELDLRVGQAALVEDDDGVVLEADDLVRRELRHARGD